MSVVVVNLQTCVSATTVAVIGQKEAQKDTLTATVCDSLISPLNMKWTQTPDVGTGYYTYVQMAMGRLNTKTQRSLLIGRCINRTTE